MIVAMAMTYRTSSGNIRMTQKLLNLEHHQQLKDQIDAMRERVDEAGTFLEGIITHADWEKE